MCITVLLLKVDNKSQWNGELLAIDHYGTGIYWDPVNTNGLFKNEYSIAAFCFLRLGWLEH